MTRELLAPNILVLYLLVGLAGCDGTLPAPTVRPLPAPPLESPACNFPAELRQRNWVAANGEGSCVFASLCNHVQWLNDPRLAQVIRGRFAGGEYSSGVRAKLDSLGVAYQYTESADGRFLDWCSATRRGAILWWKPAHCCTFVGWVTSPDGRQFAAILDNNYPDKFELTERGQFMRLWAGYGGFALAVTADPTIPVPWPSYEVIP